MHRKTPRCRLLLGWAMNDIFGLFFSSILFSWLIIAVTAFCIGVTPGFDCSANIAVYHKKFFLLRSARWDLIEIVRRFIDVSWQDSRFFYRLSCRRSKNGILLNWQWSAPAAHHLVPPRSRWFTIKLSRITRSPGSWNSFPLHRFPDESHV